MWEPRNTRYLAILTFVALSGSARADGTPATANPAAEAMHATAVPAHLIGVENFHEVNGHVFRGAQPTKQGWVSLSRLGVKTIIDLRRPEEHSIDREKREVEAAGMHYVNFPMNGFDTPNYDQIAKVLGSIGDQDTVFIHCRQGRDRTGTVVAAYRMSHDRWDMPKAMDEASTCGMHWYEFGMRRFLRSFPTALTAALANAAAAAPQATGAAPTPTAQAQLTAGKAAATQVPQLSETKTVPQVQAQITAPQSTAKVPAKNSGGSGGGAPAGAPGH